MLAIGDGDSYSSFIDRLAKENKVSFPVVLKLYQKIMIHDSMKAGVYEIHQGHDRYVKLWNWSRMLKMPR